jgi:predicted TPR repeat methyltransferase
MNRQPNTISKSVNTDGLARKNPQDRLLDIGIGTGLGSMPFAKTGLEIFGIDGSVEMLKICKSKEFATDLKQFNLQNTPRPFGNPKRLGRTDVHAQR